MDYPSSAPAIWYDSYGPPEVLTLRDTPVRAPGAGEVLVRVRAAGVNPADTKNRSGYRETEPLAAPRVPGADAAGEVVAVGEGVTALLAGDRVIARAVSGAYATFITVRAEQLTPLPEQVTFSVGAALPIPVGTAYQVFRSLGLTAGETVLVHAGAGAVGQAAIQLARHWGARVIATGSPGSHGRIRELGAIPVAYGDGKLEERVREISPDGVDVVIEGAGTSEAITASVALVKDRARVGEIVNVDFARYGVSVFSGRKPYSIGPELQALRAESIPYVLDLIADGRFEVEIADELPLAHAAQAHRLSEAGHVRGKLILVP